jgi:hypothetical protein
MIKAGKALNERLALVRIQLKKPAASIFGDLDNYRLVVGVAGSGLHPPCTQAAHSLSFCYLSRTYMHLHACRNEMVIRFQPAEAIYMKVG